MQMFMYVISTIMALTVALHAVPGDSAIAVVSEGWAFRPVRRPEVPTGESHPVDALVRRAQGVVGVAMSREADRVTLIRRLSLDLRGLPPSPSEVDAFLRDSRPDAYERLVDLYLASPSFGERWARPWLDLVRYADSDGFELDTRRPNAWRYRDWVIDSLNADMPYDRFIGLQLAADELAPDESRQKAALGFLRNGPTVANERTEKVRMDELDDLVTTTSSVFLGLTVGCARCHDHKADPIPTEDYYRLIAVFAPAKPAEVPLAGEDVVARSRETAVAIEERLDVARVERSAIERAVRDQLETEGKPLDDLTAARSPLERSSLAECQARIDAIEARRPSPIAEARGVVESSSQAAPVPLLIRGDVNRKGPFVKPGPPRAVSGRLIDFPDPPRSSKTTRRRASLAEWIAGPAGPLTSRVEVNRIWLGHFGTGLVRTPADFGAMGDPPALPDLLDYLAAEFVAQRWSRKAIHRLIVTSRTYRQSSRVIDAMKRIDPGETLVWRYPLHRLDAEAIRDSILHCAGTLNRARGGPGVFPPIDPSLIRTGNLPRWPLDSRDGPEVWRRSLYLFQMRSIPLPLLEVFDLPDRASSCPSRTSTTVPTQSLTLLNNPFIIEQARRFAARVASEAGPETKARVTLAFQIATGRRPSDSQWQASSDYLLKEGDLAGLCQMLFNTNGFLYLE